MEQTVRIDCFDTCVYTLKFPQFFETATLTNCKKLFKYLFQFEDKGENDKTIAFLDTALPELCAEKKGAWHVKSVEYQNGFLSTDRAALPSNCVYRKQIIEEVARRKRHNEALMRKVKSAKSQYEHAKKVWESYTDEKQKH